VPPNCRLRGSYDAPLHSSSACRVWKWCWTRCRWAGDCTVMWQGQPRDWREGQGQQADDEEGDSKPIRGQGTP
jgi:hypothetical protein